MNLTLVEEKRDRGLELKFIQIAVKFEQLSFALAAINNMYIDNLVVSEKFNFSKNCMCHGGYSNIE